MMELEGALAQIRTRLGLGFLGVTFAVTGRRTSKGAETIEVSWAGGPSAGDVRVLTSPYARDSYDEVEGVEYGAGREVVLLHQSA
jgi:hypothetical protein